MTIILSSPTEPRAVDVVDATEVNYKLLVFFFNVPKQALTEVGGFLRINAAGKAHENLIFRNGDFLNH